MNKMSIQCLEAAKYLLGGKHAATVRDLLTAVIADLEQQMMPKIITPARVLEVTKAELAEVKQELDGTERVLSMVRFELEDAKRRLSDFEVSHSAPPVEHEDRDEDYW